ncbi:MAG: nucleotidyltransferase family protein [Oscillochloris sp.]|nr:nucleotidyltransferase family protein [Oscillochloris sp.]
MSNGETQPTLPPMPLEQVLSTLRTHRSDLTARYHLSDLGVFGSYVRGEQGPESDIDILVSFTVTPSIFTLLALEDELQELLNHPVDLAVKSALRPHIGTRILREVVAV